MAVTCQIARPDAIASALRLMPAVAARSWLLDGMLSNPTGKFLFRNMSISQCRHLGDRFGLGGFELVAVEPDKRDGRNLLFTVQPMGEARDLWVLPLDGDRKPVPLAQTPFKETTGRFSSDGRWIAYQSNETGRAEVYVQSFPDPKVKVQVSRRGGGTPFWRGDGRELFYSEASQQAFPPQRQNREESSGGTAGHPTGVVRPRAAQVRETRASVFAPA
jgi:hypothetical protein